MNSYVKCAVMTTFIANKLHKFTHVFFEFTITIFLLTFAHCFKFFTNIIENDAELDW